MIGRGEFAWRRQSLTYGPCVMLFASSRSPCPLPFPSPSLSSPSPCFPSPSMSRTMSPRHEPRHSYPMHLPSKISRPDAPYPSRCHARTKASSRTAPHRAALLHARTVYSPPASRAAPAEEAGWRSGVRFPRQLGAGGDAGAEQEGGKGCSCKRTDRPA